MRESEHNANHQMVDIVLSGGVDLDYAAKRLRRHITEEFMQYRKTPRFHRLMLYLQFCLKGRS